MNTIHNSYFKMYLCNNWKMRRWRELPKRIDDSPKRGIAHSLTETREEREEMGMERERERKD